MFFSSPVYILFSIFESFFPCYFVFSRFLFVANVFLVAELLLRTIQRLIVRLILSRPSTLSVSEKNRPPIKVYSRESARPPPIVPRRLMKQSRAPPWFFQGKWLMKCKVCLSSLGSNPLPDPERNSGSRTMG